MSADRAVLFGTETYFAAAVPWFKAEDETDLLAAVPEWWSDLVHARHAGAFTTDNTEFDPISIVCGWDGRQWTKAIGAPDPVLLYYFLEPDDEG